MTLALAIDSLPSAPPQAPAPARGIGWIGLDEAARRMDRAIGHVARLCRSDWSARGLARLAPPAGGGKPVWTVREDADERLLPVAPASVAAARLDLNQFTRTQRDELLRRERILLDWRAARAGAARLNFTEAQATAQFLSVCLAAGQTISRGTLFRWEADYRHSGLAGLVDARWKASRKKKRAETSGPSPRDIFFEALKGYYLRSPALSKEVCYQLAVEKTAEQLAGVIPAYRTACRWLDEIPSAVATKFRRGDEAYKNEFAPHITRDYSGLESNEIWCGDHHQFDVICTHQGRLVRPWLTAWQDLRSRKIVGWHISASDPNSDTILLALRAALLAAGKPKRVMIDNGKDYDCYALMGRTKKEKWHRRRMKIQIDPAQSAGIFRALEIEPMHVWPYHGQSKPIERFFGTLESRLGKTYPTYCGRNPQERPEGLEAALERGQAITVEQLAADFGNWLEADYHARPHSGDSMENASPDEVFAANLTSKIVLRADLCDLLLMRPTKPVKVTQIGVTYKGLHYGANEASLFPLMGKEVRLRVDDGNLSQVRVFDLDDRFICIAEANSRIPVHADSAVLREAIAEQKANRKLVRDYHEKRTRLHEDLTQSVIAAAHRRKAKQQAENPTPPVDPPSLRPFRSPLEAALTTLESAFDQPPKIAVGGESMTPRLSALMEPVDEQEEASPIMRLVDAMRED